MVEPAGPGADPLRAIQARLVEQIPNLYRDLALYLQVLRDGLPVSLDQACSHLATQVHPRRYNRLHPAERQQLHQRLKTLLRSCCSLLTVEQLLNLASQMARERQRLALREHTRLLHSLDEGMKGQSLEGELGISFSPGDPLPAGSVHLNLAPPLSGEVFPLSMLPSGELHPPSQEGDQEEEASFRFPTLESFAALSEGLSPPDLPWSSGQLPRDPVLLLHCLDGLNAALGRRLRNLSHSVNLELVRAGLIPSVVPVPLLDAVLLGQIEPQGAPANLLRLSLGPADGGSFQDQPMGVLLRTVDLEMEQPRLRTCRRRLLHHRQEILKMAETSHRLQRRLQAHHAERLWRHDSQLNPPGET